MNTDLTRRLSDIVRRQLKEEHTSVSYAILRGGALLAADALGVKDRRGMAPADEKCTYNIASVSKIFCTVAVMQLAEQGLLDLDAPVCRYLPRLEMPLDARFRDITLRHCLSHASGLPGTQWRGFSVSDVRGSDYYADVYDYLRRSTLKADPGTYSVYCNDGFTLAEMAVAAVAGMPFAQYCLERITGPLKLESTRLAPTQNPDYTVVREGKKPAELLLIQGGAGFTTTMADLALFGSIFLHGAPVLGSASMAEMARPQGRTFLRSDERSPLYGLGWDNVDFRDPGYDLGAGVLLKGGNSFQFDTQFLVVPKYDAVLAISETHDCGLNLSALILRLFATAMQEEGVNICRRAVPVAAAAARKYAGLWLTPSAAFDLRIDGAFADAVRVDARRKGGCLWHDLAWNGSEFELHGEEEQQFLFDGDGADLFLMIRYRGRVGGCAQKARDYPAGGPAWEARVGRRYLPCALDPADEVIYDDMSGLRIEKLPGFDGLYQFAFSGRADAGVYGFFESTVRAVDAQRGRCFLRTPGNPSRDLIDPYFYEKDGAEYCDVASYTYRDAASLAPYAGQPFPARARENGVYRLAAALETLPAVPEGRRLLVLDRDMVVVYDSLFSEKYQPAAEGFLILI